MLCVLTNGIALLTVNHRSPLHSLSDPEERCRGTVFSSLFPLYVRFIDFLFFVFLTLVQSTDVPNNFTVKWATKTTVVLAWKFSEGRSRYTCMVSLL